MKKGVSTINQYLMATKRKLLISGFIILITMTLFRSFFAASQAKYDILLDNPLYYEINQQRNRVYIYDIKDNLYLYNVDTKEIKLIAENINAEVRFSTPLLLTPEGLFFRSQDTIYEIEDDRLTPVASFFNIQYNGYPVLEATEQTEKEIPDFDKLISECSGIDYIMSGEKGLVLLKYPDKKGVAFLSYKKDISKSGEENKKTLRYIPMVKDTTFRIETTFFKTINYIDNNRIIVDEREYSCKRNFFKVSIASCKYKMKIKHKNSKVVLKDTTMDSRVFWYGSKIIKGMFYEVIPTPSIRITDKYDNIYFMFNINGSRKMIKLPVEQFL